MEMTVREAIAHRQEINGCVTKMHVSQVGVPCVFAVDSLACLCHREAWFGVMTDEQFQIMWEWGRSHFAPNKEKPPEP